MFEQKYVIRFSEIDRYGKLSMNALLRIFQDCGYSHALFRDYGQEFTKRTRLTWFLLSWKIKAISMPEVGEEVTVRTWIYDMQSSIAKKSIVMYDKNGNILAVGDTMWACVNVDEQVPANPERWPEEDYGEELDINSFLSETEAKLNKVRRIAIGPEFVANELKYKITDYILDTNFHANNVRLTELAMSIIGADAGCLFLRAQFARQAKADSYVVPRICDEEGIKKISLTDEEGNLLASFAFI